MLLGGDFLRFGDFEGEGRFNFSDPSLTTDLFNPDPRPVSDFRSLLDTPDLARPVFTSFEEWYGFYLQDQIKLPYDVHLLAGFRYDNARNGGGEVLTVPPDEIIFPTLTEDAVTPRYALLWRPIPELSLFRSYAENFGLSNFSDVFRQPLPPQEAEQWEAGLKTEFFGGRLTGTLAWFDLTKTNVPAASPDPIVGAQGLTVATGEARNRGLELDVSGEILPGWNIIGSYAYTDSEITKDRGLDFVNLDPDGNPTFTDGNQGNRLFGVPRHSGSLWTTYEQQAGPWRGLALGAGMVARGQREGDNENSFQLPGYATVNLMAAYTRKLGPSKVSLQLNVDNLLDQEYFDNSVNRSQVNPGAPRTFLGSVRVEF